MPRRRLGVVLTVPSPLAGEIEGLRRACGDPMLGRVAPHLTLVPPVNVREEDLPATLAALRRAAGDLGRPLHLHLGPPATFHPVTPVLYLGVSGPGSELEALHQLRAAVFAPPLHRPLTHPFHPHVTLGDDVEEHRLLASVVALARYRAPATFHRVHLLEERRGSDGVRRWPALADATLEPPVVVGTGGLNVELTVGEMADPEVLDAVASMDAGTLGSPLAAGAGSVVVVGRRDGAILGAARADVTTDPSGSRRGGLVWLGVVHRHRGEGVARHLVDRLELGLARAGADEVETSPARVPATVAALLEGRGWAGSGILRKNLGILVSRK